MSPRRFACSALFAAALAGVAVPALAARDVMLVLDNSGSMRRNDPARLAAPAVAEFVKGQPVDTRVGIILFGAGAELAMPLTFADDAAGGTVEHALARFDYRGRWTETAAAVERALYELRGEGRPGATRAIVLMTDGLIDTGDARRDAELHQWLRQDLAAQAAHDKIGIFGIAFTERADYQLLQSLASATGAEYFRVLSAPDIGKALQRIESVLGAVPPAAPPPEPPPVRPAAAPPIQAAEPAPAGRGLAWAWWAAAVLLLAGIGGLAWQRREQLFGAKAGPERPDQRDTGGPLGVLFDSLERHEIGEKPVVIGRAGGNDPTRYYLVIPEKTVGRWHATIERRGQTFWLRDEGSINGTFINGERIVGERPLKHRDAVRIHTHEFEFEIPELGDADRTVLMPTPRLPAN